MSIRPFVFVAAISGAVGATAHAGLFPLYSQSFDAPLGVEWSGVITTTSVQGFAGLGNPGHQFGGSLLYNDVVPAAITTLTLGDLPTHNTVSVGFLLAVIDSWDGLNQQGFGPDFFNVRIDGVTVFSHAFASALGAGDYSAPAGGLIAGSGQMGGAGAANFGWNGAWNDSAFDMHLEPQLQNLAHTSSTLTIDFFATGAGWQGGSDESWGIDDLVVALDVPAPGGVVLAALGAWAAMRRRR